MKLCVCSIAHGERYEKLAEFTHPIFRAYAARIGADFKELKYTQELQCSAAWLKLILLWNLLKTYDRVIFLDTDVLLHPDCPNLFDVVPETHFGAYQEGELLDRTHAMFRAIEFHKIKYNREYQNEYFNSGVMVMSKIHRDLFIWPEAIEDNFYEQSLINARVFASGIPFHKLHYHYNRMSCHDQVTGEDVFAAEIVHFAGMPANVDAIGTMKLIQEKWASGETPKTRIHISCGGGIGDVVMSEPIVRYCLERMWPESEFPDYKFVLSTAPHCTRIFEHLKHWKRLTIIDTQKDLEKNVPYITLETHPKHNSYLPHAMYPQMHNQQWAAYNSVRTYLTPEELRIKLMVKPEDEDELDGAVNDALMTMDDINTSKSIAVHCGIGWPSKTFPASYWQEIVDGLSAAGFQVILFGKRITELIDTETGEVEKVCKGVVPVKCPANGIDLRDKLSMGGLFALINKCKATLTNDSLPTHCAAAFDNWFFLIASCKHPDLVMPFRMGSQRWRARAFFNKLTLSVENMKPNTVNARSIADVDGNVLDYIPTAKEVVNGICATLDINAPKVDLKNLCGGGIGE